MSEVVNEVKNIHDYNNGMRCSPLSYKVLYDGPSSSKFSRHGDDGGANNYGPKDGSLSLTSFTSTQFHKI